jgi:Hexokinase
MVGVIVGTGTNACYVETVSAVTKWKAPALSGCEQTVINVEWGAYTSPLLPRIPEDGILDTISTHPGRSCKVATGGLSGDCLAQVLSAPVASNRDCCFWVLCRTHAAFAVCFLKKRRDAAGSLLPFVRRPVFISSCVSTETAYSQFSVLTI